ncbi:MAG: IS256 family transposase [Deltaproteobacteria bacterium]|nr:IS256 family transposase [Deltaproteobacteria bacterium]NIS77033.1 IS256 family transposase [Deltaproteobacteria bacterium]
MLLEQATPSNVSRAIEEINAFEWEGDFKPMARQALKQLVEKRLDEEMKQYLGLSRYERAADRVDYRNGHYTRHLLTEIGDLELSVPRSRKGRFPTKLIERYARRCRSVDRVLLACFCLGLSTRKAASVLAPVLGERVSATTISRIAQGLDQQVKLYHSRPVRDQYHYLFFDGVVLKSKGAAKVQKKVLLCAFGITVDGRQEMIDFYAAPTESEACWEAFLRDLYQRGLQGGCCELIVTDGGTGLHGALQIVYPNILAQRCWAHKTRNVLDKVKKADQPAVKKALNRISHAANYRKATQAYWRFASRWRKAYPKAVACLEKDLDQLLYFFQIKRPELWSRLRTTNLIERSFREVRRRTRPMGVMANSKSLQRIVFAVFHHLNQNWSHNTPKGFTHKS